MQRLGSGLSQMRKGYFSLTLSVMIATIIMESLCDTVLADDRVMVDIDELPDLLKYTTFPESQGKSGEDYCTYYLGCMKIQNGRLPKHAVTMQTEFFVYSRTVISHSIPYKEDTINCLKASQGDICGHYPYDLNSLLKSGIDFTKKIVIITSGFYSKVRTDWQLEMAQTWIEVEDVVVIVVAWPGGNSKGKIFISYDDAVANTRVVARQISSLLFYLGKLNGNIEITQAPQFTQNIHLIGHSLGAHISGFVGKDFEGNVGRVTGLDPAGPQFNTKERVMKLDRRDGQLVECYHTNAGRGKSGKLGHELPLCHLDYYVNGGVSQPTCGMFQLACSHKMINDLFINLMKAQADTAVLSPEDKSKSFEMLYAFVGDSYDSFRLGKSFSDHCPKFAMPESNRDLTETSDFGNCAFPVDLLLPFNRYKSLLEHNYSSLVNLNSNLDPANKTYFQSFGRSRSEPILLRAKYPQFDNNTKNQETYDATNFEITLQFSSYEYKNYTVIFQRYDMQPNVVSGTASFNLLVPLQIPAPTYLLTQFINSQYYVEQTDDDFRATRWFVASVFPVQIQLKNLKKPANANFIPLTKRLTLSLLRKTNRSILITYSHKRREGGLAEVYIMKSEAEEIPNMDFECDDAQARYLDLYIDKIIIGPPRVAM